MLVAILALALSACGVPDSGPVVTYGKERMDKSHGGEDILAPPRPSVARDPIELVKGYLQAANGTPEVMPEQVKEYFTEMGKSTWQPGSGNPLVIRGGLKLERKTTVDSPQAQVTLTGDVLGALRGGSLDQGQARSGYSYTFELISEKRGDRPQWVISNPPPGMLLSVEALLDGYEQRPVYFRANGDARVLVPDMRYVPRSVSRPTRDQFLMNWLLGGPSSYVSGTVGSALPVGTELRGVPVVSSDVTVVDLSAKADLPDSYDAMAAQLAWTLRARSLELRIEGRAKPYQGERIRGYDTFKSWNPVAVRSTFHPFAISAGRVIPVAMPDQPPCPVPRLLANQPGEVALRWATALSERAALVAEDGTLWLGRATQFGALEYRQVEKVKAPLTSQPQLYLVGGGVNLIAGAGPGLLVVDTAAVELHTTEVTGVIPGEGDITSVSVAPDGRRIAFVRGGRAYAGTLAEASLLHAWPISASLTQVTSVSWDREEGILVSGVGRAGPDTPPGVALWQVTFDGGLVDMFMDQSTRVPVIVAAYVPPPGGQSDPVVEAEGRLYPVRGPVRSTPGGAPFYAG